MLLIINKGCHTFHPVYGSFTYCNRVDNNSCNLNTHSKWRSLTHYKTVCKSNITWRGFIQAICLFHRSKTWRVIWRAYSHMCFYFKSVEKELCWFVRSICKVYRRLRQEMLSNALIYESCSFEAESWMRISNIKQTRWK